MPIAISPRGRAAAPKRAGALAALSLCVGAWGADVPMEVVAHRGLWKEAHLPQNSLEAIRAAYAVGARTVETDFWETKSGEIICLHNRRDLEEMSSFSKNPAEITPEDRARIDLGAKAGLASGPYRIPLLADVLAAVPKDRVLQAEIKVCRPGFADRFHAAVEAAGLAASNLVVSASDLGKLAEFGARHPEYRTLWLANGVENAGFDLGAALARAGDAGVDVFCPGCRATMTAGWTRREADAVRAAGFELRVSGVRNRADLRHAAQLGAAGFTCDFFKAARRWARESDGIRLAPPLDFPLETGAVFGEASPVAGTGPRAMALESDGRFLYGGAGGTLYCFDLSDPLHPGKLGEVGGLGPIRQIAVQDGFAYVAAREYGLWIVDVSDPARPRVRSRFDTCELATGVDVAGGVCFCGQRQNGIEFIDVSDPDRPRRIAIRRTPESQSVNYRDGWLWSGEWGAGRVTVFDARDMAAIRESGAVELHGYGDGVWPRGNRLYASRGHHSLHREAPAGVVTEEMRRFGGPAAGGGAGHGLEIFDLSDPASPKRVGEVDLPPFYSRGLDMWTPRVSGDMVFAAQTHNGLFAIDVSDEAAPRVADRWTLPSPGHPEWPGECVSSVAVGDGVVYAAVAGRGFFAIPCKGARFEPEDKGRAPANAAFREECPVDEAAWHVWRPEEPGQCRAVAVRGDLIYAACGDAGLHVLRARPGDGGLEPLGQLGGHPRVYDVAAEGDRVFTAEGADGFGIYDASSGGASLVEIARIPRIDSGRTLALNVWKPAEGFLACSDRRGVVVYDIRNLPEARRTVYVGGVPGWDRFLADRAVGGGRFLAYSKANTSLVWIDLRGGGAPSVLPETSRNRLSLRCGVCAFDGGRRVLASARGGFYLLDPGEGDPPDGGAWRLHPLPPAFPGDARPDIEGIPRADGPRIAFTSRIDRRAALYDLSAPGRPQLLGSWRFSGNPDIAAFCQGRVVIPCGYAGVLLQRPPDAASARPPRIDPSALRWHLPRGATRNGDILSVNVPADATKKDCRAWARIDLSAFDGRALEATIETWGEGVANPPKHWLGLKFQLEYADPDSGETRYPNTSSRTGDFPRTALALASPTCERRDAARLVLGLQGTSGNVSFDLSTLRFREGRPFWPVTNQTLRCEYTSGWMPEGRLNAAQRSKPLRGVMSPGRDMTEDDFATLASWGATLLRYQMNMPKGDGEQGAGRDPEAWDRWLQGRLDHFESVILPMCRKYGLKVVLDMHTTPGGRLDDSENAVFRDAALAERFVETWRGIARRFAGNGDVLYGYDLVNEPVQRGETPEGCDYWSLQRRAAEAIRQVDPEAPVIVEANFLDTPAGFATHSPLALANVIYEVHVYNPIEYTHQGVGHRGPGGTWPDTALGRDKDFLRRVLAPVRRFEERHGAKIYVGEFSAIAWAPGAGDWLRDCIERFDEYGWDWTYHAFREWDGWSLEHAPATNVAGRGPLAPSADNPRKRAVLEGLAK